MAIAILKKQSLRCAAPTWLLFKLNPQDTVQRGAAKTVYSKAGGEGARIPFVELMMRQKPEPFTGLDS